MYLAEVGRPGRVRPLAPTQVLRIESPQSDVASPEISKKIFVVRGQRVLLDSDLAESYGVKDTATERAGTPDSRSMPCEPDCLDTNLNGVISSG